LSNSPADDGRVKILARALVEVHANATSSSHLQRSSNVVVFNPNIISGVASGIQHALYMIYSMLSNSPADDGCVHVLACALVEIHPNAASSSHLKQSSTVAVQTADIVSAVSSGIQHTLYKIYS
jgi:hypothetical protein